MDHSDYLDFLRRKIKLASFAGFDIADDEINPILKPHQRACVKWAVRGGNRALFERFGLGKSVQQLEIVRLVMKHAGGPGLIVCPLGVRQEFRRDGEMLGVQTRFIRRTEAFMLVLRWLWRSVRRELWCGCCRFLRNWAGQPP